LLCENPDVVREVLPVNVEHCSPDATPRYIMLYYQIPCCNCLGKAETKTQESFSFEGGKL